MNGHIEEIVSAYLDDELSEEERRQAEGHLKNCPACRKLLNELVEIQGGIRDAYQHVAEPESLEERVLSALKANRPSVPARSAQAWLAVPVLVAFVAALALFAAIGSYLSKFGSVLLSVVRIFLYAAGSVLGSQPAFTAGLIAASLILMIGSGLTLKRLIGSPSRLGRETS